MSSCNENDNNICGSRIGPQIWPIWRLIQRTGGSERRVSPNYPKLDCLGIETVSLGFSWPFWEIPKSNGQTKSNIQKNRVKSWFFMVELRNPPMVDGQIPLFSSWDDHWVISSRLGIHAAFAWVGTADLGSFFGKPSGSENGACNVASYIES